MELVNAPPQPRRPSQRILEREYLQRLSINPAFSKRAFARQMGLTPAFLSNLMNGRRSLTARIAKHLVKTLSLPQSDGSALYSETIGIEDQSTLAAPQTPETPVDLFEQISDWWYIAILEFLETSSPDHSAKTISRQIGVPINHVTLALKRLKELGVIQDDPKRQNRLIKVKGSQLVTSATPNAALRKYHSQLLDKGKEALYFQSKSQRIIGSLTIACDPSDLVEVERRWNDFRQSLETFISQGRDKSSVYTMVFEGFRLSSSESEQREIE